MLYLKSFKNGVAICFDDSGDEFQISLSYLVRRDDVYGKRVYGNNVVVPVINYEWVICSDEELHKLAETNKINLLKRKLAGDIDYENGYLLEKDDIISYYYMSGEIHYELITFMIYNKLAESAIIDLPRVRDGVVKLSFEPNFSVKMYESDKEFCVRNIFYKDGEWYYTHSLVSEGRYKISLKELLGVK